MFDTHVSNDGATVSDKYVGSTTIGNTRAGSANHARSGTIDTTAWPGLRCVTLTFTGDIAGSPDRGSTRASQAIAPGIRDTTFPLASTKSVDPSARPTAVRPFVRSGTYHPPAGTRANAAASRITKSCSKPAGRDDTRTSTPAPAASRYVADCPSNTGPGNAPRSHTHATERPDPWSTPTRSEPAGPPAENDTPDADPAGASSFPDFKSDKSTSRHAPDALSRKRTGAVEISEVNVPSGFTHVVADSDRNPNTSTRAPVARA